MKILIVDDTPTNIDILVEYLQDDYDLLVALNGTQALKILEKNQPDLILLDIMMPQMDGFETCEHIKSNLKTKEIPVIFLTANSDENSIKKAFAIGGIDFIHKPIVFSELSARITTHLSLSEYKYSLESMVKKQTEVITKKTDELTYKLYHDENTGLKNLFSLQKDLPQRIGDTLLLLDINNFNIFNKIHGFLYGDKILKEIGINLHFLLGKEHEIYKLSSDRYSVLIKGYDESYIENLIVQMFAFFDMTEIVVDGEENTVSFNIGIAKIDKGSENIIDAEYALDISKYSGKHFRVFYSSQMENIKEEKHDIERMNKTKEYIYKDMIIPYYQPIVDVKTQQFYKYEALARIHDGDTVITPDSFLGPAERLGLLTSITKSMISKTFKQFSNQDIPFSINITQRDIKDGYLMDFIKRKVILHNINPNNITFEVLENITLSNKGNMINKTLSLIKEYGCHLAIDDFGSENANFGRLLSLNSDYLKIDGMFITGCDTNQEKRQIIKAIVGLAKNLDIKTIAEYVSSESIFNTIRDLGVDYAQGYYFGKPSQIEIKPF